MVTKNYNVPKYVKLNTGKVIDTSQPFPHVECYFIINDELWAEEISGREYFLGKIVS